MDTQKVVDKDGDQKEWVDQPIPKTEGKRVTGFLHGYRRLPRVKRSKQREGITFTVRTGDIILVAFEFASIGQGCMRKQDFMQLHDVARGDGDHVERLMNKIQDVPISSNFLFFPVFRRGLFRQDLAKPCIGGANAFDRVAGFGTLYFGDLGKLFEFLRLLLAINFLFAIFLADEGDEIQCLGVPRHRG